MTASPDTLLIPTLRGQLGPLIALLHGAPDAPALQEQAALGLAGWLMCVGSYRERRGYRQLDREDNQLAAESFGLAQRRFAAALAIRRPDIAKAAGDHPWVLGAFQALPEDQRRARCLLHLLSDPGIGLEWLQSGLLKGDAPEVATMLGLIHGWRRALTPKRKVYGPVTQLPATAATHLLLKGAHATASATPVLRYVQLRFETSWGARQHTDLSRIKAELDDIVVDAPHWLRVLGDSAKFDLALRHGQRKEGLVAAERLVAVVAPDEPASPWALSLAARVEARSGRTVEAQKILDRIMVAGPSVRLRNVDGIREAITRHRVERVQ